MTGVTVITLGHPEVAPDTGSGWSLGSLVITVTDRDDLQGSPLTSSTRTRVVQADWSAAAVVVRHDVLILVLLDPLLDGTELSDGRLLLELSLTGAAVTTATAATS